MTNPTDTPRDVEPQGECTAHDLRGHLEQMIADGTSCPHCIELARHLLAVHPVEVTR